ncbi:hypothetical protein GCM10023320_22690 [Pseudonocardia adelaidensis]|uniref:Uncharacterized protein n=1 Tax=Pseudonocardia adelaidensis TaxID=648754 RepID=A0ABP9NG28_9PSEU
MLTSRPAGTKRAATIVTAGRRAMLRWTQPAIPPPPGRASLRDVRPSVKSRWSPATDPTNAAVKSPSAIGTSWHPPATADAVISSGSLGTTGNGPSSATSSASAGSNHALCSSSATSIPPPRSPSRVVGARSRGSTADTPIAPGAVPTRRALR